MLPWVRLPFYPVPQSDLLVAVGSVTSLPVPQSDLLAAVGSVTSLPCTSESSSSRSSDGNSSLLDEGGSAS